MLRIVKPLGRSWNFEEVDLLMLWYNRHSVQDTSGTIDLYKRFELYFSAFSAFQNRASSLCMLDHSRLLVVISDFLCHFTVFDNLFASLSAVYMGHSTAC